MKAKLNDLLKAINLANLDGVKQASVDIEDLLIMRETILSQQEALRRANKNIHIVESKLALRMLDSPIRLKVYA